MILREGSSGLDECRVLGDVEHIEPVIGMMTGKVST
jgi:hypothetical protein